MFSIFRKLLRKFSTPFDQETHVDLFPLLHNRMSRENQHVPKYIGEFDCVDALPKGSYPAVYYWIDRSIGNIVRLSFNTQLLQHWCVDEAHQHGFVVDVDSAEVKQAIEVLQKIAASTLQSSLAKVGRT